jgi:hypothetical protein
VPKAFELNESFSKSARLPQAGFQKWRALCCPLFKRELFIGNLHIYQISKPAKLSLAGFQKLLVQLREVSSNRSTGFELTGFEKFSASSKVFGI